MRIKAVLTPALTLAVMAWAAGAAAQDERPPLRPTPPDTTGQMQGPPAPPSAAPVGVDAPEDDQDFAACRLALSLLGTSYTLLPPQSDADDPDCGMARPLQVWQIIPGVPLSGEPVMRCDTARALGFWTRDFLRPAAALLDDAPRLNGIQTGPGYACRARIGTGADQPKQSEHAYGSAIDIAGFEFDDGSVIAVEPRTDSGSQEESFQRAARGTACLLFTTVLGPGANAAHDNHLHLDLASRNGGWRLCE